MKIGDKVEVIKYGALAWEITDGAIKWIDTLPSIVGKQGVIVQESNGDFAVHGIKGKYAWYNREQLKKL